MKKVLLSVLIICLVFAGLFVSCKNEIEVPADELVSVGFSNSGSRALSSNLEAFNPSDYYWAYAAQKADGSKLVSGQTANYGAENEVTLWVKTNNGVPVKGLGDSSGLYQVPGFSQGLWNFKLYAFKDVSVSNSVYSGTGLLYKGETTGVLLKSSATNEQGQHSVNVIVSPVSNTSENGTLVIKTAASDQEHITMTLFGTYTSDAPVYGTDYFPRVISIATLDATPLEKVSGLTGGTIDANGSISLPAGTYKVTFAFADKASNPTVNYARGSVIATVYSNLTTTIKGNLNEADVYAEFTSNLDDSVIIVVYGTDDEGVTSASIVPSIPEVAAPSDVGSSNQKTVTSAETTINSNATAVATDAEKVTSVTIPAEGLANTVVTKTLTAYTDEDNKTVTTVTQSSTHDLSMKVTDAEATTPSTISIASESTKVAGVNLILTRTTTTVYETATTTSGATVKETTSTTAEPETITSFNTKYVTVSTYIETGLVDVKVLYDGANQNGLVFDEDSSTPSVEIASNDAGDSSAGTGYNPTTGLLVFKTNHFSSYIITCAPALVVTNGQQEVVASYASLAAFREAVNSGTSFAGQTVTLQRDVDLAKISWTPIGTKTHPFRGTFDGNDKTINNLSNHGFTSETDKTIFKNYNSGSENAFALFGYVRGDVTIKDLTVNVYASDKSGKGYAGIVGLLDNDSGSCDETTICNLTLSGITVNGAITAEDKVAGVIAQSPTYGSSHSGSTSTLTITGCTNNAAITGERAGGILSCGGSAGGKTTITNCVNDGNLKSTGTKYSISAGIVAHLNTSDSNLFEITGCSNTGVIDATIGYNISANAFVNNPKDSTYSFVRQIIYADNVITSPSKVRDLYYSFAGGPYIENVYDANGAYVSGTAVRWKELEPIIGNNSSVTDDGSEVDHTGLLAGIAYDLDVTFVAVYSYDEENGRSGLTYKFTDIDEALMRLNTQACYSDLTVYTDFEWSSVYTKKGDGPGCYRINLNTHTMTLNAPIHEKDQNTNNGLQKPVAITNGIIEYGTGYTGRIFDGVEKGGIVHFYNVTLEDSVPAEIISIFPSTPGYDRVSIIIDPLDPIDPGDSFIGKKIRCLSPGTGGGDVFVLNEATITMDDPRWVADGGETLFTIQCPHNHLAGTFCLDCQRPVPFVSKQNSSDLINYLLYGIEHGKEVDKSKSALANINDIYQYRLWLVTEEGADQYGIADLEGKIDSMPLYLFSSYPGGVESYTFNDEEKYVVSDEMIRAVESENGELLSEQEIYNIFSNWEVDYRVSISGGIDTGSCYLYGAYMNKNDGKPIMMFIRLSEKGDNEAFGLLDSWFSERSYQQICDDYTNFYCGFCNSSEDNEGKTVSVTLRIKKPASISHDYAFLPEYLDLYKIEYVIR